MRRLWPAPRKNTVNVATLWPALSCPKLHSIDVPPTPTLHALVPSIDEKTADSSGSVTDVAPSKRTALMVLPPVLAIDT